jgi:hypothetical protein
MDQDYEDSMEIIYRNIEIYKKTQINKYGIDIIGIRLCNNIFTFSNINLEKKRNKLSQNLLKFDVDDEYCNNEIKQKIICKWRSLNENEKEPETYLNLMDNFILTKNNGVVFVNSSRYGDHRFCDCISSPLLLYKCSLTFPKNIKIYDSPEYLWDCRLIHKDTNNFIKFNDKNNNSVIGLEFVDIQYEKDKVPDEFFKDILELFNYLISDQCI